MLAFPRPQTQTHCSIIVSPKPEPLKIHNIRVPEARNPLQVAQLLRPRANKPSIRNRKLHRIRIAETRSAQGPEDGSKTAQEGPKSAPRGLPRKPHEANIVDATAVFGG
eukprot:9473981-Pyramimonas_sp.AAC.1